MKKKKQEITPHNNMEWKQFKYLIYSKFKANKNDRSKTYNDIYNILDKVQPDDGRLISTLRADAESDIQLLGSISLQINFILFIAGFIGNIILDKNNDFDILSLILLTCGFFIIIFLVAISNFMLNNIIKRYKFVLCIIDDFFNKNLRK